MLKILRSIVQEVSSAPNLDSAMRIIVERVRSSMAADLCSIYLLNPPHHSYILRASTGLKPETIGQISLKPNEGLIGYVAEEKRPINLTNAQQHERFRLFPESGEELFHGFLGIPIIQHGEVLGVLVVQQKAKREFSEDEVAFLVTVSAQLAGVITQAKSTQFSHQLRSKTSNTSLNQLHGLSGAPGIAIGKAVVVYPSLGLDAIPDRRTANPAIDLQLLEIAVQHTRRDIQAKLHQLESLLPKETQALFEAYLAMLESDTLIGATKQEIESGLWVATALRVTFSKQANILANMDDLYLRQRASDILDLGRQILNHLEPGAQKPRHYPSQTILIGEEITPSILVEVPAHKLAAMVQCRGAVASHSAILAQTLGIPAVMGISDLPLRYLDGLEMIVDGYRGQVQLKPDRATKHTYQQLIRTEQSLQNLLNSARQQPCRTLDGVTIELQVNLGLAGQVTPAETSFTDGVGLFRTETLFQQMERFPSEQEQYQSYRDILQTFHPKPVCIRTLDIGGDKSLPYFPISEENPFLGWRGIRISLDHPEVFHTQLHALMRANLGLGNLHISIPMITQLAEINQALCIADQVRDELIGRYNEFAPPPIGMMAEVPAAIFQCRQYAKRADFVSIGTNDLTQYLLAVDRNNSRVAKLYDHLHPAVLTAIATMVADCAHENTPVSVCGEMAGDPLAAVILVGLGVHSLSMPIMRIPRIKWILNHLDAPTLVKHSQHCLQLDTSKEIREHTKALLIANDLQQMIESSLLETHATEG